MRRAVACTVLVVSLALPAVARAAPPWSEPVDAMGAAGFVSEPAMAFSGDGRGLVARANAHPALGDDPEVVLSRRTVGGAYRTARRVTGPVGGQPPRLVAYGEKRAVLLRVLPQRGEQSDSNKVRVGISFGRTDGDIEPFRTLDEYRRGPQVPVLDAVPAVMAADDDGRIAIAYVEPRPGARDLLWLTVRAPGGRFERRVVRGSGRISDLALDVGDGGDVAVAYRRDDRIEARVQRSGHSLGRAEDLGPADPIATLDVSVATSGRVAVAWGSYASDGAARAPLAVRAALRPPGPRRFGAPQSLLEEAQRPGAAEEPPVAVATAPDGAVTVAWTDGAKSVRTAAAPATDRFSEARTVAADGMVEDVAVGPLGTALVVWSGVSSSESFGGQPTGLFAALAPAGADFGPAETVTEEAGVFETGIAVDPSSRLPTVIWNAASVDALRALNPLRASTRG